MYVKSVKCIEKFKFLPKKEEDKSPLEINVKPVHQIGMDTTRFV